MSIPFIDLKTQYAALRDSINGRIQRVLDHGQYILGPEVAELEQRLAAYSGARHCISCASGTEALLIALMALDIKPGDEVITTPFTFVATAEMIVLLGAKPVFVDVQPHTCNIDPGLIERTITVRTRAIMPVSLYGQPADMDQINTVAAKHGLPVIEDAAQSFGAQYQGRRSGNLSVIGCTSFFPSKPLGCYGDGGALFTSDDSLAEAMREIRVHGQPRRYHHTRIGVAGRLDTIQAAVLLAKLERFDWEVAQRERLGARYTQLLAPLAPEIKTLQVHADRTSVYAQYTVRVATRDDLARELQALGVPTAVHYPVPLHLQPAYAGLGAAGDFPIAERLAKEVISLPFSSDLSEAVQNQIVSAVTGIVRVAANVH